MLAPFWSHLRQQMRKAPQLDFRLVQSVLHRPQGLPSISLTVQLTPCPGNSSSSLVPVKGSLGPGEKREEQEHQGLFTGAIWIQRTVTWGWGDTKTSPTSQKINEVHSCRQLFWEYPFLSPRKAHFCLRCDLLLCSSVCIHATLAFISCRPSCRLLTVFP